MNRSGWKVSFRLIGLVRPLVGYMCLAVAMGLTGHLFASFITIFGAYAVLDVLGVRTPFTLRTIFVSVVLFAAFRAVLRYGEQTCNHYIAFNLLAIIRDRVFRALRKLCPAKLEGRDKGDLISVITSDVELLEVFYAHTISPIAIWTLYTVIMTVFIGFFHWALGILAFAAYLTVGIVIPVLISKFSGDAGLQFRTKAGELSAFVLDSLRGLSETLQYSCGGKRLEQMNAKSESLSSEEKKMKQMAGTNAAVSNTVIWIYDIAMLFLALSLYRRGLVSLPGVLVPAVALFSSFGPSVALANLGSTLQSTFAAGNRILDILDEQPDVEDITEGSDITFRGAAAEHIRFRYDQELVLDDFSVNIPENQVIGIVGRSGSGKSTFLKLLMRFWSAQEGMIRISGTNIEEINTASLREAESYMTQETQLFHDSIRNNLKIAKLDATDDEIIAACKKASVHDFIMSLPQGYDTPVGELGDTLSGGERQRIGLARAFLHDAPFLLLDEPTSNLDSLNEAIVLKALHAERKDKTVVLVSHRQSTMRIADQVISVENGRISG